MDSDSPSPPISEGWLRLALLALSLGFGLIVGEIALRVLGVGAPRPAGDVGGFTFFAHDVDLGWDLVPLAKDRHQTDEFDIEIAIDAQGLRSARASTVPPADGRLRLVALGDSFTFGHGVDIDIAWPAQVDTLLPAAEVINLAVTGYGTDQQLLRYEQRRSSLEADAVVLGLFVGNVFRNARDQQLGYAKPHFTRRRSFRNDGQDDGSAYQLVGVPVPETPAPSGPSRLWNLLSHNLGSLAEHLGYGEAWPTTGVILERLRAQVPAIYVVILPKDQMIYGDGLRRSMHERSHARLHQLLEAHDLPYLDLTDALRRRAELQPSTRLYFDQDGHWSPAGHQVAGEAIASWLQAADPRLLKKPPAPSPEP